MSYLAGHNPLPNAVRGLIIGGWIAALVWWERRRALRRVVDSKIQRDARNLAVAAGAGVVMQFVEAPLAFALAEWCEKTHSGLLQQVPVSGLARGAAAIVLLDYTLYLWHVLTHRIPLLWRFHRAHHIDREMDATTALRFHFGEMALSVGFRAAQVVTIGPAPMAFAVWQMFLFVCILFHHSNVRLPLQWERLLARIVVTPRLHGIHHSIVPQEVNSNWSSGLTVWDWLHGTLRTDTPQERIVIGVAGFLSDSEQRLGNVLSAPFRDGAAVPAATARGIRQPISQLE